jgi:hypothetical protein
MQLLVPPHLLGIEESPLIIKLTQPSTARLGEMDVNPSGWRPNEPCRSPPTTHVPRFVDHLLTLVRRRPPASLPAPDTCPSSSYGLALRSLRIPWIRRSIRTPPLVELPSVPAGLRRSWPYAPAQPARGAPAACPAMRGSPVGGSRGTTSSTGRYTARSAGTRQHPSILHTWCIFSCVFPRFSPRQAAGSQGWPVQKNRLGVKSLLQTRRNLIAALHHRRDVLSIVRPAVPRLHARCSGPVYVRLSSSEWPRSQGSPGAMGWPHRAQATSPAATRGVHAFLSL